MTRRPVGATVIGALMLVAVVVCVLSTVSLVHPGTPIDVIWQAKPESLAAFQSMGGAAVAMLGGIGIISAYAGFGLLRRWFSSWLIAVIGLFGNSLADFVRIFTGDVLGGLLGFVVAGGLAAYLLLPGVRRFYRRPARKLLAGGVGQA